MAALAVHQSNIPPVTIILRVISIVESNLPQNDQALNDIAKDVSASKELSPEELEGVLGGYSAAEFIARRKSIFGRVEDPEVG